MLLFAAIDNIMLSLSNNVYLSRVSMRNYARK